MDSHSGNSCACCDSIKPGLLLANRDLKGKRAVSSPFDAPQAPELKSKPSPLATTGQL